MFLYLTSRLISSTVAFIYPGYASYKTLSQRPASEADLERWLMYWTVLGCIVGVEYLAEWMISWFPFYYPIKTLFLLYLVLPQTRGSSYLYISYLQPFFRTHESDIDAALASLKTRVYTFIQERARMLWEHIVAIVAQSPSAAGGVPGPNPNSSSSSASPPTLNDPVSGPVQMLGGLWRTYGPSIVASGAALLHQGQQSAAARANQSAQEGGFFSGFAASTSNVNLNNPNDTHSVLERRRQLEEELASLHAFSSSSSLPTTPPQAAPSFPMPVHHGSTSYLPTSPLGSSNDLRSRAGNGSPPQFEEIEVPSDVEGYDVGSGSTPQAQRVTPGENKGERTDGARRTSWLFGWGGSPPAAGGTVPAVRSPAEGLKEE